MLAGCGAGPVSFTPCRSDVVKGCVDAMPERNKVGMTVEGLEMLLAWLDADRDAAGRKYEALRRKLLWFFIWRGCPEVEADALADETLDRMAEKLEQGVLVLDINKYALAIANFVWLEFERTQRKRVAELPEQAVGPDFADNLEQQEEQELRQRRQARLKNLLAKVLPREADRRLLYDYYGLTPDGDDTPPATDKPVAGGSSPATGRNKAIRKNLAQEQKKSRNALKVKVSRLRKRVREFLTGAPADTSAEAPEKPNEPDCHLLTASQENTA